MQHAAVFGATRSGKTYFCNKNLHRKFGGTSFFCHFYDSQTSIDGFQADKNEDIENLKTAYRQGLKVNYELSSNPKQAVNEIGLIYNVAKRSHRQCQIIIDEAHRLVPERGRENIIDDAIRDGLKNGVRIILISQSPADIRKTTVKQIDITYIFRLNSWEYKYFENKGFDIQEIRKTTDKKFGFVKTEFGEIYSNKL